jgi:O-antigen/teichoic acid export membrane protein
MSVPHDASQNELSESGPADAAASTHRSSAAAFTRNSLLSVFRLLVSAAAALLLPGYLTHILPVKTYAAWVLILQLSAYVSYFDLGIQSGIAKFVAEYEARNDLDGASMHASAGLVLMSITSALGACLTLILAWQVPRLFRDMPAGLYSEARTSILLIGFSLSFLLFCSIFPSIFFGLQRYAIPTLITAADRIAYTVAVLLSAALHKGLAVMAAVTAIVHACTGVLQWAAWRRWVKGVRLHPMRLKGSVVWEMLGYCTTLAIWTAGMLCVSGLDVAIVGRYDYARTAYYSIATLPTNFVNSVLASALAPLIPASSALNVGRTSEQMGSLLARVTRYSTLLLLLTALPMLIAGYPILRIWVGADYAIHTFQFLRILVIANVIRNICLPYASFVVGTNNQRVATTTVICEALVNLSCSLYFVRHIGAIGVAYGTLIGAFISAGMHFAVSMHFTFSTFAVSRRRLFTSGILRPAIVALPTVLLLPFWWRDSNPALTPFLWAAWTVTTLFLACKIGLDASERQTLPKSMFRRLAPLIRLLTS